MASLSEEVRDGRIYRRIQFVDAHKVRRSIRLPGVSERDARVLCGKVDELVSRQMTGAPLSAKLTCWLQSLPDVMHDKLSDSGLVERRRRAKLGEYFARYVDDRRESLAASTIANFEQAQRSLVEFLGADRLLRDVTVQEAEAWQRSLLTKYATATSAKHVKRARQVFKAATKEGICYANPLAELRAGAEVNPERKVFVSRDKINAAIEAAPDADWRMIIALSRYGGLRCPSEVLGLRWRDVDLAAGVFKVTSPKTKKQGKPFRVVPVFRELRTFFEESLELAEPGAEFVVGRYRGGATNLRSQLERILSKANVTPWPRLFHNLRGSRETELANEFPLHVVTEWLGNSVAIASRHYLSVTPDHIAQANGIAKPTDHQRCGGAASGAIERKRTANSASKTPAIAANSGITGVVEMALVPPFGLENGVKTSRKEAISETGGARSSSIANESSEFGPLSHLQHAHALAASALAPAAAGEALSALSQWLRDLAQIHNVDATIDGHTTLCQLVDALEACGALSRSQAAQCASAASVLAECVYGASRSPQSLVAILDAATELLQGK